MAHGRHHGGGGHSGGGHASAGVAAFAGLYPHLSKALILIFILMCLGG